MLQNIKQPNFLASALFIVLGLFFTYQMINKPLSDWGNYYYGSHFLLNGTFGKDVYEPYKFNIMVREAGETDIFLNYTPIPPFTSLFYIPFQLTGTLPAKIIFCFVSVLVFGFSFFRFTKYLGINSYWLITVPFILFFPMRNNVFFGQTYLLVIAALMEGYIAYKKDKKITAAFLWSLAILLKLFPGIVLLFLLFKKDYKQLGITAGFIVIISVITAAITGFALNIEYFTQIMPRMLNNEINDTYASSYQSMLVLLNKIFIYDKLHNPGGNINNPVLFKILNMFYSLSVIYICAMFTLKKEGDDYLKFSLWILAGLLITGYGSSYSLLLLVFITLACLNKFKEQKFLLILLLGFVLAIASVPVHLFSKFSVALQFPRLYMFIAFFALVMLLFKIIPTIKYAYVVPLLAMIIGYLNAPIFNDNNEYVFEREEAILIYDYGESNGKLRINFIDQNGRNEKELKREAAFVESNSIELKDNQIFYNGKQLTNSKDNKLKPMLNAKNEIYYLSDKNRGVGFYALRKMNLNR